MSFNLRLIIILVALTIFCIVLFALKKGRIPIKYSLIWLLAILLLLTLAIFPNIFVYIASSMGFTNMVSMVIGIFIFILFIVTISLTIIVSGQKKKNTLLIQELSIMKEIIDKLERSK